MSRPTSLVAPGNWQPSKADTTVMTEHIAMLMRAKGSTGCAPAVTVLTNIAGAVSVLIDQTGINAGRRLRSIMLPDNPFNPFRNRRSKKSTRSQIDNTTTKVPVLRAGATSERNQLIQSPSEATAAAVLVTSITHGVRKALHQWTEKRSLRQSMILWKHECSRYTPPSHLGCHPNHLSTRHPESRPPSPLRVIRPFLAPRRQEKASSVVPLRSEADVQVHNIECIHINPDQSGGKGEARPRSAVPRLGESSLHAAKLDDDGEQAKPQTSRLGAGFKARGYVRRCGSARGRSISTTLVTQEEDEASSKEKIEDIYDDIYEDLDDEDDELDNRISIMERRFSSLGRERPISAIGCDGMSTLVGDESGIPLPIRMPSTTRSARYPPRAPQRGSISTATDNSGRAGDGIDRDIGLRPTLVIRRPTSAPVDDSLFDIHRQSDPMAALHARRMRLRISSAGGDKLRPATGVQHGLSEASAPQQQRQPKQHASRDVTTAVPSWKNAASGGERPLSSATVEFAGGRYTTEGVAESHGQDIESAAGSRPSSVAFRRWLEARPSARSVVSAVSSARTIGLDDPELVHLQVEMESRRGGASDVTLARMEEFYSTIVQKNDMLKSQQGCWGERGRSKSPLKNRGGSKMNRTPTSARSSKCGSRSAPRSKGSSRGAKKASVTRGNRKKRPASSRRRRNPSKGKGEGKRGGTVSALKKTYTSAKAYMVENFPSGEDEQSISLLGMEQEMECRQLSAALSRAGILVSGETLRRALVIPTDHPLETCLAGLPLPMEGLQDKPFPLPAPAEAAFARRAHPPRYTAGVVPGSAIIWPKSPPKQSKRAKSPFRNKGRSRVCIGARAGAHPR